MLRDYAPLEHIVVCYVLIHLFHSISWFVGSPFNFCASRGEFCVEDRKPEGTGAVGPEGREGGTPLQANFLASRLSQVLVRAPQLLGPSFYLSRSTAPRHRASEPASRKHLCPHSGHPSHQAPLLQISNKSCFQARMRDYHLTSHHPLGSLLLMALFRNIVISLPTYSLHHPVHFLRKGIVFFIRHCIQTLSAQY